MMTYWSKLYSISFYSVCSVSDCREAAQDASSADSLADQEANEFGRNGGDCEKKYLCKVSCKYNPYSKTCRPQNC